MRIFYDRLIDEEDRTYMKSILAELFPTFGFKTEEVLTTERIIFGDFLLGKDVEPRHYFQAADLNDFIQKMDSF
jgi:dynein heavy chain